jgi:hypothetical protein
LPIIPGLVQEQGAFIINNNNIIIIIISFTFGSKNNNILQLRIILNNEASVLESFFQIFGMASKYFSEFLANPKIINYCLTGLCTRVILHNVLYLHLFCQFVIDPMNGQNRHDNVFIFVACVEMVRWMKVLAIGMFRFVDNVVSLELLPNANYAIIFNAIPLWVKED